MQSYRRTRRALWLRNDARGDRIAAWRRCRPRVARTGGARIGLEFKPLRRPTRPRDRLSVAASGRPEVLVQVQAALRRQGADGAFRALRLLQPGGASDAHSLAVRSQMKIEDRRSRIEDRTDDSILYPRSSILLDRRYK